MPEAAQWMECDRADGLRTAAHERRRAALGLQDNNRWPRMLVPQPAGKPMNELRWRPPLHLNSPVSPPEPAPQQPGVVERSEVEGSPRKPTRDRTNVKSFHNPVCQKPATTFERTGMSLKFCGSEIIEPDLSGIRLQPGTPIGRVRRAPKQRPATHIWPTGVAYEAQLPFADLSGHESLPLPIWCCGARTGSTAIYALGLRSPNGANPPRKPIEVHSAKQILERLRHAPGAFGLIDRTGAGCERLERVYGRAGA
jgi:hypothetical protein